MADPLRDPFREALTGPEILTELRGIREDLGGVREDLAGINAKLD